MSAIRFDTVVNNTDWSTIKAYASGLEGRASELESNALWERDEARSAAYKTQAEKTTEAMAALNAAAEALRQVGNISADLLYNRI